MTSVDRAIRFTLECHSGQYRKGSGLPYFVHPMAVLNQLSFWGIKDETTLNASLGHDIREECPNVCTQELLNHFTPQAVSVIDELTFIPDENSSVSKPLQKEAYLDTFAHKSIKALVIKIADRICNTLDFYCGGQKEYAAKYWAKASWLILTIYNRQEEIVSEYGLETFNEIRLVLKQINDLLKG